jgi:hypothetical protein
VVKPLPATMALLALVPCLRADVFKVDLASQNPGETMTLPVAAGSIVSIVISNRIPGRHYDVTVIKRVIPIEPLSFPKSTERGVPEQACIDLIAATKDLFQASDEKAASETAGKIEKLLPGLDPTKCPDVANAQKALAEMNHAVSGQYLVGAGEELEITVERKNAQGNILSWKVIQSAGDRGKFFTSYGFLFIPTAEKEFFSKTTGTASDFVITRKADRKNFDFAPSVLFTWLSTADQASPRPLVRPTLGLGFDLSTPVVFAGVSLTYNINLALVGGVVMHQQRHLSGEFNEGQTIHENLSSEKLTSTTYKPNWFFGVAFRFDTAPFSGKKTATPLPADEKPTKGSGDKPAGGAGEVSANRM